MPACKRTHATAHLISPAAENHTKWIAEMFKVEVPEMYKNKEGHVMHAVVKLSDDNYVYLADKACEDWGWNEEGTHEKAPEAVGKWMMTSVDVPSIDDTFAWALENGASELREVRDEFWGSRYGILKDPWGFAWALATTLKKEDADDADGKQEPEKPAAEEDGPPAKRAKEDE